MYVCMYVLMYVCMYVRMYVLELSMWKMVGFQTQSPLSYLLTSLVRPLIQTFGYEATFP